MWGWRQRLERCLRKPENTQDRQRPPDARLRQGRTLPWNLQRSGQARRHSYFRRLASRTERRHDSVVLSPAGFGTLTLSPPCVSYETNLQPTWPSLETNTTCMGRLSLVGEKAQKVGGWYILSLLSRSGRPHRQGVVLARAAPPRMLLSSPQVEQCCENVLYEVDFLPFASICSSEFWGYRA